ncbi:MAG: SAM-dependent methyltransferase, partial [Moraxellaceae bacterium]
MLTINFQLLNFKNGDKLLDLGCGEGRHVIHACLEHNIIG